MTLRGFYGFDDTVTEPDITLGGSAAVDAVTKRTGAGSLLTAGSTTTGATAVTPPGLSSATVYVGMAIFYTGTFVAFRAVSFNEASLHCGVGFDTSGHVVIYGPANTVIATSTYVLPASAWAYLEAKAVIADAGGSVEVKVDGTVVVSFSGDTRNAQTGVCTTINLSPPGGSNRLRVDDMYILDSGGSAPYNTYLGDIAVRTLLPDGNGDSSDWVGSDGNSVNNYQQVDEANSSATDYNGTALTGKTDLYTVTDIPTTDVPLATQLVIYAAKSDAGTPPVMKPVTKGDGGTVLEESAIALSTTYQVFQSAIRTTDPDGDALTATNVNAMQIGVRSS